MAMMTARETIAVQVGNITIGGGAPVSVQSMTNTPTADIAATVAQIVQLATAGAELVRITINHKEAAAATPEIVKQVRDLGCNAPIIGDFHYNGHTLLSQYPQCAQALDKYRINPGNVGTSRTRDAHFATICQIATDYDKPVRIGVNIGSLSQDLIEEKMTENTRGNLGKTSEQVLNECMIISALRSTEQAIEYGLRKDQIIISCKSSSPNELVDLYRDLSRLTDQPLHLGLTEAGMGIKGIVWSAIPMGILLSEGIGDTIRVSLTPTPGGDRREEVYASCEILQALGLRSFAPAITACPGCGRTSSKTYLGLAEDAEKYVRTKMPEWKQKYIGVETLKLAVMGCVVNGPGESRAANVGISLPSDGEGAHCPVFIDGHQTTTLAGSPEQLSQAFFEIINEYVENRYPPREQTP